MPMEVETKTCTGISVAATKVTAEVVTASLSYRKASVGIADDTRKLCSQTFVTQKAHPYGRIAAWTSRQKRTLTPRSVVRFTHLGVSGQPTSPAAGCSRTSRCIHWHRLSPRHPLQTNTGKTQNVSIVNRAQFSFVASGMLYHGPGQRHKRLLIPRGLHPETKLGPGISATRVCALLTSL